ncbi:ABC-F family ATP-binding cassette domain-containing protein [Flammeovirga kamogawensis]|uniref:ATP-binding cassette domain-containing protein n=1 Tax=Flammeovirga kamogawensis TaxID=373891 RepID=A0ABX8GXD4_9BACT|nr:ABC-F family ATP-binding cassette domain-containing protein [Flammeovirga kamogawensis]MBB6460905.1 ATP-binding cassette subfamily F protein 3 [Flammeovirga kamogawensis]QWG08250.1 ATP-binding cassette domain-containing protein [Flammeovirga kamogawensis]TRX70053.1 ABC-F family ATP-binding cassette domain-containing protein [Flammeovirga kamogawensis]
MLAISNVSFHFGSRTMYQNATLTVYPKNRIGIVGHNGAGKTTLLKLINGDHTPDEGQISMPKGCTIGFLNQDLLSYQTEDSILHVAMEAFGPVLKMQEQMEEILHEMETDYKEELVEKLADLQEKFEALDGYSIKSKAEAILAGLGFKNEELEQPLHSFSGGWRMRVMLGKLLLMKPDVLMLDEPTNHLDLPSIQWIENYLSSYEGAVLIVSHDREFLDRAINQTVEVSNGRLTSYSGNYSFYLEEKEVRAEHQKSEYENQQKKIKDTEKFIERFRSKASKAKQVQSRVKHLDRMDLIEDVRSDNPEINMDFKFQQQPGKVIAEITDFDKAYGNKVIFKNANVTLMRGDKVALIGANGKGKSTLLRLISGREDADRGSRKPGHNIITAFYAQHQLEDLVVENEILEELKQAGSEKTEQELRGILGCFLFHGDEIFKKIKVLSGGEKSRVALAKTLISEANFLMLDEPTNHLDIPSVNILIQALKQYLGTYLVVSHDRHFISKVANKIWYIEDTQLKEYPGTYLEWKEWKTRQNEEKALLEKLDNNGSTPKSKGKKAKKVVNIDLKDWQKKYKKAKSEMENAEEKVMELEEKKEEIESSLANPEIFGNPDKLAEVNAIYAQVKKDLDEVTETWEEWTMEVDELEEIKPN